MAWINAKEELPKLYVSDEGMSSYPVLVTNGIRMQVMSLCLHKFDTEMTFRVSCCSEPENWSIDEVKFWMPLPMIPN